MIRTNVTEVHMTSTEARDLADLMEQNGHTSIAAALDTAALHADAKAGGSAHIGLIVDSLAEGGRL